MSTRLSDASPIDTEHPLVAFSRCHQGILGRLAAATELPGYVAAAARARTEAADLAQMFSDIVLPHHEEEERELFPAVLHAARPGQEADDVAAMVSRLTRDHREIERMWKGVARSVRAAARGASTPLDEPALHELVRAYMAHARFEESFFLPLAERVLGRDDRQMAALGLSLHMRRIPGVVGYI